MIRIPMVDLKGQYQNIKSEIDLTMAEVLSTSQFINGPVVANFEQALATYLDSVHVVSCANGTDALQIALMSLKLEPEDEIIVPSFTYIATAEVIALLGYTTVMIDVDPISFNISAAQIEAAITDRTRAIIPVHLFGQSCDMDSIMNIADQYGLFVIEDNAQAIGATYISTDQTSAMTGTIGHIGCTSFFPTKNLGAYGDGGAICTNDKSLAEKMRMIANHGQREKYHHEVIGCNSRLDALQAAVLSVKLKYLDQYSKSRQMAAAYYHQHLNDIEWLDLPVESQYSNHVYHQYTIRVKLGWRDKLQQHLKKLGIASMIYYPIPLYRQPAFQADDTHAEGLQHTELLCDTVLSLPMHTELTPAIQDEVIEAISSFEMAQAV